LFGQPYETHKCAYNLQEECRRSINIKAGAAYSYHCALTDQNFMVVKSDLRCVESCQHQTTHASLNSWRPQANSSIRTVPTSVQTIHFKDVHKNQLQTPWKWRNASSEWNKGRTRQRKQNVDDSSSPRLYLKQVAGMTTSEACKTGAPDVASHKQVCVLQVRFAHCAGTGLYQG